MPPELKSESLGAAIVEAAQGLGFVAVGITSAEPLGPKTAGALERWLAAGMHGEMSYLVKPGRLDPRALLPQARSVIAVGLPHDAPPAATDPGCGFVARYARGQDYHRVIKEKLHALAGQCAGIMGQPVAFRTCVDTAPLLERALATRAGLGFVGKNGLLIAPGRGSYLLLGALLLAVDLPVTQPQAGDCGDCVACLEACPTQALTAPYELDARRCLSYLTIELRGSIPASLRPMLANAVCGCDICQEVCPHNRKRRASAPELVSRNVPPTLEALLTLGSAAHKKLVRGTALSRLSRNQLARNAAVALGNRGDRGSVALLAQVIDRHPSPLVRAHAAWALGRLGGEKARAVLVRVKGDGDPEVNDEVEAALRGWSGID